MYPHSRARIAGMRTAAADISFSSSEHSHTSKYILSPLIETLLCNAMRRIPTERGKYLQVNKPEIRFQLNSVYWDASELLLPIKHTSTGPVQPILFESLAVISFKHFEHANYVAGRGCLGFLKTSDFILAENKRWSTNCCDFWIHIQCMRRCVSEI